MQFKGYCLTKHSRVNKLTKPPVIYIIPQQNEQINKGREELLTEGKTMCNLLPR